MTETNKRTGLIGTGEDEGTPTSSCGCCATPVNIKKDRATGAANITTLSVPDIVCGGCAGSIERALSKLPGVARADVDVNEKKVTVEHDERAPRELIVNALERAGYEAA